MVDLIVSREGAYLQEVGGNGTHRLTEEGFFRTWTPPKGLRFEPYAESPVLKVTLNDPGEAPLELLVDHFSQGNQDWTRGIIATPQGRFEVPTRTTNVGDDVLVEFFDGSTPFNYRWALANAPEGGGDVVGSAPHQTLSPETARAEIPERAPAPSILFWDSAAA